MCVAKRFCFCTDLNLGVKIISAVGIFITLVYIVLLIFAGREVFVILSFYHVNYIYFGIIILVINFFIHCLLWSGAKKNRKGDLVRKQ